MAKKLRPLKQGCVPPVLFIIFNRPDTTKRVFQAIRGVRPTRLFVACDGARPHKAGEKEAVEEARKLATKVGWDCDLKVLFRDKNLGCRAAVSSAIDWFFEHVGEGIILEDDCVPEPSFFRFCGEMLDRYREDPQIMAISGDSHFPRRPSRYSYFFARQIFIWGWATWKRAWRYYEATTKVWPEIRDKGWLYQLFDKYLPKKSIEQFEKDLEEVYVGGHDTWGYWWSFACLLQAGLEVVSEVNLIANIGFDQRAAHTSGEVWAKSETFPMKFPLKHPPRKLRDCQYVKRVKEVYHKVGLDKLICP